MKYGMEWGENVAVPRDKKNKKQKRMAESRENVGVCDKWIY